MELARHAESLGVDAIANNPTYLPACLSTQLPNTGMTLKRSSNTDYVIYNIPHWQVLLDSKSLH